MAKNSMNRRHFIAGMGATGLGFLTARSWSRVLGANDRIAMALIGSGGRGRGVMRIFLKNPGVEFSTICDVYEANIAEGIKIAGEHAKSTYEYSEVLDNKEIQAVLIATPDHWHGPMLFDGMKAGKDIYLEKPMSYSIKEGVKMVKAVRESKQIVQIGMQRRSSPAVQAAKKIVTGTRDRSRRPSTFRGSWIGTDSRRPASTNGLRTGSGSASGETSGTIPAGTARTRGRI